MRGAKRAPLALFLNGVPPPRLPCAGKTPATRATLWRKTCRFFSLQVSEIVWCDSLCWEGRELTPTRIQKKT